MKKRTREKIALIVFIALIFAAGAVISIYLSTGRTWTRAATALDDSVGFMDGYTAVVFAGTAPKDNSPEVNPEAAGASPSSLSSTSSNTSGGAASADDPSDDHESNIADAVIDTMGLRILALYPGDLLSGFDGVFVSDVRDLYERKDANAVTLDLSNTAAYSDGQILRAGNRNIGIVSIDSAVSARIMQQKIEDLQTRGADCIVCIAPRPACITYYQGFNAVIFTDPDADITQNDATKGTAIIQNPQRGEVGVIIFTKNNTTSTKTISVL
jgi:hypothetical protein